MRRRRKRERSGGEGGIGHWALGFGLKTKKEVKIDGHRTFSGNLKYMMMDDIAVMDVMDLKRQERTLKGLS